MPRAFSEIEPLARSIEALKGACVLCDAVSPEHPEWCRCWCHDHASLYAEAKTLRITLTHKSLIELKALAERVKELT